MKGPPQESRNNQIPARKIDGQNQVQSSAHRTLPRTDVLNKHQGYAKKNKPDDDYDDGGGGGYYDENNN